MRSTLAVALLAGLLVLAGCVAPSVDSGTPAAGPTTALPNATTTSTPAGGTATTSPTPAAPSTETTSGSATTEPTTTTRSGDGGPVDDGTMAGVYGIDANLTVDRVEELLAVTIDHPRIVVSSQRIEATESGYSESLSSDPFLQAFGLASEGGGPIEIAGYVRSSREIVMSPNLSVGDAESTLAHETVHVVQRQKRWRPAWNGSSLAQYWQTSGREVSTVGRVITEGTAQYVGYAYSAAYQDGPSIDHRLTLLEKRYRTQSGATRLAWAPYYYGLTYIHDRVENTTGIGDIFGAAPLTTEQLLHDETPETEPLARLSVDVEAPAVRERGPQGELFTRIALRQKLPERTAERAAAGWGNDRLFAVETGNVSGHVWVTRWDTPEDATQFADGIETFSALQFDTSTVYDPSRPNRRTVVVTVGPEALADRTSVTASGPSVDVSVASNESG